MAIYEVQAPDGSVFEIEGPDDATDEQISTFAASQFGQAAPAPPQAAAPQAPATERQQMLASRPAKLLQGARDPIDAGAQLLPKGLEYLTSLGGAAENPVSRFFGSEAERVTQGIRAAEQEYQKARTATGQEGLDAYRLTGNVLSPVNIAVGLRAAGAVPAMQSATANLLARGAAGGAAVGALQPALGEDFSAEKAAQIGTGAVLGPVGQGAANALGRVVQPVVQPAVQRLLDAGVSLTPGRMMGGWLPVLEDKLTSVPILGDAIRSAQMRSLESFNRAALNEVLEPVGQQVGGTGRDAIAQVRQQLGAEYDRLLPNLQFRPDQQFGQELAQLNQMASGLTTPMANRYQTIIRENLIRHMTPQGNMNGASFKAAESEIGRLAKAYRSSGDPEQRELGNALASVLGSMRSNLSRSNPQYADELGRINEAWARYVITRRAASSVAAEGGVFTPAQLQSAVKASDASVGKGRFAEGTARMQELSDAARSVLPSRVPDSGTAGRLTTNLLAGGGVGMVSPTALGTGLALSSAYTQPGNALLQALLTQRPDAANLIAQYIRQAGGAPITGAILPALESGQ